MGIYPFLYGEGWVKSQAEMLENGLTLDEYKEFAALQQGILSRFEQRREILFDGKQINGRISKALDREVTQRIQMIFQDPMSSLNERAKVDILSVKDFTLADTICPKASVRPRWQAPCLTWVCCRNLPAAFPH